MSRNRTAWLAGAVAVLLAAAYLLHRRQRTPARAAAVTPPAPAGAVPVSAMPVPAEPEPEPRSWDGGPGAGPRVVTPERVREDDEELPLPTWVRLSIVGLALLAFFAVSLIATKQV